MRRLCVLLCALVLAPGCATDGREWDEFWKDLRGDNMRMRSGGAMSKELWEEPSGTGSAADRR
jgi:hypothetical protein